MTKDQLGLLVLLVGLLATVFGAGSRIGTLTEQLVAQTKQLEQLTREVAAINRHFIEYTLLHRGGEER